MDIEKEYPDIVPEEKKVKVMVVKTVMFVLGKSMENTVNIDDRAKQEVQALPDDYTIQMEVAPNGPYMSIKKVNGRIKYLGQEKIDADLSIVFRNIEMAFKMMTTQISFPALYCQCGLGVKGDVSHTMIFYRFSNIVQSYLFPKIIAQRVLKRVDEMNLEKFKNRLMIYAKLIS